MNRKNKVIIFSISAGLLAVILIWGGFFIGINSYNTNSSESSTITRTLSGKSLNDDKLDAVNAAAKILNLSKTNDSTKEELTKTLTKLSNGDTSSIPNELNSLIRFTDAFSKKKNQLATYQALTTISYYVIQETGNKTIEKLPEVSPDDIYLDQETGVAFVPVSVFSGKGYFDMEMIYVDGQWKLSPYSLIRQVSVSSVIS